MTNFDNAQVKMKNSDNAQLCEAETWVRVNRFTGEIIGEPQTFDVVRKPVSREGFHIAYVSAIIQMIDKIGNRKMEVVKYVLENMDIYSNFLTKTISEIVEESGVSDKTVRETLKLLEEAGIITRKTGVIMLSPKLLHKGDFRKERYLLTKFEEIRTAKSQSPKNQNRKFKIVSRG